MEFSYKQPSAGFYSESRSRTRARAVETGIELAYTAVPMGADAGETAFDERLLEILRCPLTHSKLRRDGDWLIAERGGLAYPIRDGIPVMLVEEARLPEGVASIDELKKSLGCA